MTWTTKSPRNTRPQMLAAARAPASRATLASPYPAPSQCPSQAKATSRRVVMSRTCSAAGTRGAAGRTDARATPQGSIPRPRSLRDGLGEDGAVAVEEHEVEEAALLRVGRPRRGGVQNAAVAPDGEVVGLPAQAQDVARVLHVRQQQLLQLRPRLRGRHRLPIGHLCAPIAVAAAQRARMPSEATHSQQGAAAAATAVATAAAAAARHEGHTRRLCARANRRCRVPVAASRSTRGWGASLPSIAASRGSASACAQQQHGERQLPSARLYMEPRGLHVVGAADAVGGEGGREERGARVHARELRSAAALPLRQPRVAVGQGHEPGLPPRELACLHDLAGRLVLAPARLRPRRHRRRLRALQHVHARVLGRRGRLAHGVLMPQQRVAEVGRVRLRLVGDSEVVVQRHVVRAHRQRRHARQPRPQLLHARPLRHRLRVVRKDLIRAQLLLGRQPLLREEQQLVLHHRVAQERGRRRCQRLRQVHALHARAQALVQPDERDAVDVRLWRVRWLGPIPGDARCSTPVACSAARHAQGAPPRALAGTLRSRRAIQSSPCVHHRAPVVTLPRCIEAWNMSCLGPVHLLRFAAASAYLCGRCATR
eukprot:scaffold3030_cov305-Prasinococcus_capsulatus_cf.AAC.6